MDARTLKLVAGVVSSVLGSVIWALASYGPASHAPGGPASSSPGTPALNVLSRSVTLTFQDGRTVQGFSHGTQSLCDWNAALETGSDLSVTLPDASVVPSSVLSTAVQGASPELKAAEAMAGVPECPGALQVFAAP